ncbi:sensor histidine kinase, partial [Escherichia coli]|nr:sensor histidine kinase [Escherichia coli]
LICFALIAVLLVLLITRIARNLREGDAERAAIRQRAAEEDHIVRMGLLASGAAHELGTPLSSLSVILGDWQRMPRIAADRDLAQDIADMQAEVARCKTIVSG